MYASSMHGSSTVLREAFEGRHANRGVEPPPCFNAKAMRLVESTGPRTQRGHLLKRVRGAGIAGP